MIIYFLAFVEIDKQVEKIITQYPNIFIKYVFPTRTHYQMLDMLKKLFPNKTYLINDILILDTILNDYFNNLISNDQWFTYIFYTESGEFDIDLIRLIGDHQKSDIAVPTIYMTKESYCGFRINRQMITTFYKQLMGLNGNRQNIFKHILNKYPDSRIARSNDPIHINLIVKYVNQYDRLFTIDLLYRKIRREELGSSLICSNDSRQKIVEIIKFIIDHNELLQKNLVNEKDIEMIRNYLKTNNISLRHIFCINDMKNISNMDEVNSIIIDQFLDNHVKKIVSNLLNRLGQLIDPYYFLEMIETHRPFCLIVPSYNSMDFYKKNLDSIFRMNYSDYRVVHISDSDPLNEVMMIRDYVVKNNMINRTIILNQYVRQHQGAGRYIAYHLADDDEILILLDGDDMLFDTDVMIRLNKIYDQGYMLTYGSYRQILNGIVGEGLIGTRSFPPECIKNRDYRKHRFISSHLRTGYAKLFKQIKITDLLYKSSNEFLHVMTDCAEMFPCLEMANDRHLNVGFCTCLYNMDNSSSYPTSLIHMNRIDNEFYKNYRIKAHEQLTSGSKYPIMKYGSIYHVKESTQYMDQIQIDNMAGLIKEYGCDMLTCEDEIRTGSIYLSARSIVSPLKRFEKIIITLNIIKYDSNLFPNIKNLIIRTKLLEDIANNIVKQSDLITHLIIVQQPN